VTGKDGLKDVARLCRWLGKSFQTRPMLDSRVLTGRHDWGLMLAALPRSAGEVGGQSSYCVMFKGLDPAGYGIDSIRKLDERMLDFAQDTDPAKRSAPKYRILALPDPAG